MGIWSKRIFFFLATNFLIVMALAFVANVAIAYFGIQVQGLLFYLILYSIIGMGASFASLWMSKWQAMKAMGVQLVSNKDPHYKDLVEKVHYLSKKAGLPTMPEVGVYESSEVNAFATGPSKSNSLVAVSTGLLNAMDAPAVEGVLGHEVAHIANGDMVTMSLIQGLVNVMVYMIAHILAQLVVNHFLRGRRSWFIEYMIRSVFATLLFIPGSMLTCFFSRWREYRADQGGALFAGREKMLSALQALSQIHHPRAQKTDYSYLMINNTSSPSLARRLFSTHPPIQDRIRRLKRPHLT